MPFLSLVRATHHGLKNEFATYLLQELIEREEGVSQMVEDPHKKDEVELPGNRIGGVDGTLLEFDVHSERLCRKPRLVEIPVVDVNPEHSLGAALLHFDGVEAAIAADVEHGRTGKVRWNGRRDEAPLDVWKITEKMIRCRRNAVQVKVVKPLAQLRYLGRQLVPGVARSGRRILK